MIRAAALVLVALVLSACAAVDDAQGRLCRSVAPALESSEVMIRVIGVSAAGRNAARIEFEAVDPDETRRERFVTCRFAGGAGARGHLDLVGVETDEGEFGVAQLVFLRRFWLERPEAGAEGAARFLTDPPGVLPWRVAYAIQSVLNALPGAAVLALLATAYALLHGLTGRINLAFGEIAVVGGYGTIAVVSTALALGGFGAVGPALGFLAGVLLAGLLAFVLSRTVIAPLAARPGRMLLVATIGVALVLQEGLLVTRGAAAPWIPPTLPGQHVLLTTRGFDVIVTTMQIVCVLSAFALAIGAVLVMAGSRFGRNWRALAQDPLGAALCGVDARAVLTRSMLAAGALTGAAGAILTLTYGTTHYAQGAALGLKALLAALIGGAGSIPGALIGGALLGLFEGLWSAAFPIHTRDAAVFVLATALFLARAGWLPGSPGPGDPNG